MLKLTISRPNTIGTTFEREYECYTGECEEFIESKIERLCDKGWQALEEKGSTTTEGSIELTHDNEADVIVFQWYTINDNREVERDEN